MKEYLIVIEETENGFSAYSPDIDGCVAAGETMEETESLMKEALASHLELMAAEGYEIPKPHTAARYARIAA